MKKCFLSLFLLMLTWTSASFAQNLPSKDFPAKPAPDVDAAAQVSLADLARACAGAVRELDAARVLIAAQKAQLELAEQKAQLDRQRAELIEGQARLAEEKATLEAQRADAERERAMKLAEAERIQGERAAKAEARAKRLNGWLKYVFAAGVIGGVLLTR